MARSRLRPQNDASTPSQRPEVQTSLRPTLAHLVPLALPGPMVAVGLLVVIGWRLAGWLARDVFSDTMIGAIPRKDLMLGLAADAALTWGLFALARTLRVTLAPGPGATARLGGWWMLPALVLAVAATLIRLLDAVHCYLGQCHWTAEAFLYMNTGMAGLAASPRALTALAAALLSAALLCWALRRDANAAWRACRTPGGRARQRLWGLLPLIFAAVPAYAAVAAGVVDPPEVDSGRLVPEINMVVQYLSVRHGSVCSGDAAYCMDAKGFEPKPVPAARWQKWQSLGLVPPDSTPSSPFPLLRFGLGEAPVGHAARPPAAGAGHPNVVLTFMESMSGHFVHEVSGHYPGLTPGLNGLAQRMTSVHGFWNNTSPTVNALIALLCSTHPSRHPSDLGIGERIDGLAAFDCLLEALRKEGYRTVFIGGYDQRITSIEYFARTHGFDEVHGMPELARHFPGRRRGVWGFHDDALAEYAQFQIARLEALRQQDGRPFLLLMMTLDGHEPGMAGPTCQLPAGLTATWPSVDPPIDDASSLRQLASVHCADAAMGRLGRFILDGPRATRTLWLVTPDHALIRTPAARRILFDKHHSGAFAPLPLLIHDPLHELPKRVDVLSASTDVAPTVLHLLGFGQRPTAFTGMSIFGRRAQHPFIIGRMGTRVVMMADSKRKAERAMGWTRTLCKEGKPFLAGADPPMGACDLLAWFEWTDSLWQHKRILPPTIFAGAEGVDVHGLARQQAPNKAEEKAARRRRRP